MNVISPSDFTNWKQDPVTKAFMQAAEERIAECKDVLSVTSGLDSLQDRLLVGMITAYREMKEFRVDDMMEVE